MIYFIPAWYNKNQWEEDEQFWYSKRIRTEFDDTVKQVQLFERNNVYDYEIILLSWAPNFRHFLHRQGVFHAPYWSIFDAIQEIKETKISVFSFHDLKWPKNIEFVYTPFCVVAFLNKHKYAEIQFGEDGNLIQVDMYKNDLIYRTNNYDDRGFISTTTIYQDGKPEYRQYLMENGIWKMCYFFSDGHIEINSKVNTYRINNHVYNFSSLIYASLENVLLEVMSEFIKQCYEEDMYCIAMHNLHLNLLNNVLSDKRIILSFFQHRINIQNDSLVNKLLEKSKYIITDSKDNMNMIIKKLNKEKLDITEITPYDSRTDFGISQQLSVQNILIPIDNLPNDVFIKAILYIDEYLKTNTRARVHLFTRMPNYNRQEIVLKKVEDILLSNGSSLYVFNDIDEESIEMEEKKETRYIVNQCIDELSISKLIREQCILVDLSNVPDLYLQISSISSGIPQIVMSKTQYVIHKKNGLILNSMNELGDALSYYLDILINWNQAKINSYEIGREYTVDKLIEKWKEVIKKVRYD